MKYAKVQKLRTLKEQNRQTKGKKRKNKLPMYTEAFQTKILALRKTGGIKNATRNNKYINR